MGRKPRKKVKRIAITTPLWKRHHIFQMWCDAVNRLRREAEEEIIPIAVGSEGEKSYEICRKNDIIYAEHSNDDMSGKFNKRLQIAKRFAPDGLIMLGSDDLMSTETYHFIVARANEGYEVVQNYDIYYHSISKHESLYCRGYTDHREGTPLAPGRYISSSVLSEVDWKIWNERDRRLMVDGSINRTISGARTFSYWLTKENLFVLDIKSKGNMTPYKHRENNVVISNDILYDHLPEDEAEKILRAHDEAE